jgi:hypothetical protein
LTGGAPFERLLFDEVIDVGATHSAHPAMQGRSAGFAHGFMAYHIGRTGMGRRVMQRVDREFTRNLEEREAYQRGAVRVISAGPNAFVYMVDSPDPVLVEQLEERFPGLASRISASRGVGFVLARSAAGPVYFWRGARAEIGGRAQPPFDGVTIAIWCCGPRRARDAGGCHLGRARPRARVVHLKSGRTSRLPTSSARSSWRPPA